MRSVFPWSHSSLSAYETCPRRYYETKIAKNFVEDESEQMRWGSAVHKALELRVRDGTPLPENMKQYEKYAMAILRAEGDVHTEQELGVNYDLEACTFDADDCWSRGIDDVVIVKGDTAVSLDYKTGKVKNDESQLKLSALRLFAHFPQVNTVVTSFIWLAHSGPSKPVKYTRDKTDSMWVPFIEKSEKMRWSQENDAWPANPSGLCKAWCPVKTCPHWGKSRGRW